MANSLPIGKLKLLYLMDCADIPVSDQEILQSCVDWFSYFELQTALAEMFEQKLLICQSSQAGVRRYSVAALGKQTLVHFAKEIARSVRSRLEEESVHLRKRARDASTFVADYQRREEGEYVAHLQILEQGHALLDITINLPTIQQADRACQHWPENANRVFQALLEEPVSISEEPAGT